MRFPPSLPPPPPARSLYLTDSELKKHIPNYEYFQVVCPQIIRGTSSQGVEDQALRDVASFSFFLFWVRACCACVCWSPTRRWLLRTHCCRELLRRFYSPVLRSVFAGVGAAASRCFAHTRFFFPPPFIFEKFGLKASAGMRL